MKRESGNARGSNTLRNLALASVAAMVLPISGCKKTEPPMHCYDLDKGRLTVYVEDRAGRSKGELGSEMPMNAADLMIKDSQDPLAFFCTSSGHLLWVTKDTVYVRKLSQDNGSLKASKVLDISHISPDEYAVPGVKVISADIWRNPDARWQEITVATLTNTGLFQAARYSLEGFVKNDQDRAIFDLSRKLNPENRWPKEVAGGVVRIIDSEKFVVIPIGEKGKGEVRNFYHIALAGKPGETFYSREMKIDTMKLWMTNPELKNILGLSSPVRYDRQLGGWVANLDGEKANGETFQMFPILTPAVKAP